MAAGLRTAGFDEVAELPLADGGEGTLDALLAAAAGRTAHARGHRTAGRPGRRRVGAAARRHRGRRDGAGQRAGARRPAQRRPACQHPGHGRAHRGGAAWRRERVIVGVGGSATTDGGLAAVEALGWSLAGLDVTVACDVETPFLDAARGLRPAEGRDLARRSALLTRRLERARRGVRAPHRRRRHRARGRGAAGGLAGGLAAIGARLEPGFDVVAQARRARCRARRRRPRRHGRGQARRRRASRARSSAACSTGRPTRASRTAR